MSKTEHHPQPLTVKNNWNKIVAGSVTESRDNLPRAVYWQLIARPTFCQGLTGDYAPQSSLAKFIRSLIRRDKLAYRVLSAEKSEISWTEPALSPELTEALRPFPLTYGHF